MFCSSFSHETDWANNRISILYRELLYHRLLLDGLDREMDFCHSFDIFLFLSVMLLGQLSIYFYFPKANNFYQTTI